MVWPPPRCGPGLHLRVYYVKITFFSMLVGVDPHMLFNGVPQLAQFVFVLV